MPTSLPASSESPTRSNWTVCERCEMSNIIPCSRSAGSRQQETELNQPLRTEAALCSDSCRTETQPSDVRFKAKLNVGPVHRGFIIGWPEHKSQDDKFSIQSWRSDCWKVRFSISDPEGDADSHSSYLDSALQGQILFHPTPCQQSVSLRQPLHHRAGGTNVCMHAWQRDESNHPG